MQKNTDAKIERLPGKEKAKWITLRLILALVLFLATLIVFVAIADKIVIKHNEVFDTEVSKDVIAVVSPGKTKFMEFITFFGSATFLFPAYIVLIIFYLIKRKSKLALDITMIGLSSTGILFLFKNIFKRHRPLDPLINHVTGFSFPSGHSFSSFTFYGLLIYLVSKAEIALYWKVIITTFLFALAAIIALSRVYLRVHFPSDVVAGFCLSIVWMMIALWVLHMADKQVVTPSKIVSAR